MAIGSAIVLFVIGAILTYGVDAEVAGLDIDTIGYILMGAGLIGGLIGLMFAMSNRRRTHVVEEVHHTAPPAERVVEREYRR
ncbi:DUF6458 family protein [Euzebya sp.]|uniref:DUF6458 family protein n=1 Tax=Euzebya sp. TaxID=1971409 RepID=UPI003519A146